MNYTRNAIDYRSETSRDKRDRVQQWIDQQKNAASAPQIRKQQREAAKRAKQRYASYRFATDPNPPHLQKRLKKNKYVNPNVDRLTMKPQITLKPGIFANRISSRTAAELMVEEEQRHRKHAANQDVDVVRSSFDLMRPIFPAQVRKIEKPLLHMPTGSVYELDAGPRANFEQNFHQTCHFSLAPNAHEQQAEFNFEGNSDPFRSHFELPAATGGFFSNLLSEPAPTSAALGAPPVPESPESPRIVASKTRDSTRKQLSPFKRDSFSRSNQARKQLTCALDAFSEAYFAQRPSKVCMYGEWRVDEAEGRDDRDENEAFPPIGQLTGNCVEEMAADFAQLTATLDPHKMVSVELKQARLRQIFKKTHGCEPTLGKLKEMFENAGYDFGGKPPVFDIPLTKPDF